MPKRKFAAFILTHGRPNSVVTYNTIRKRGYTGLIYLLVDDEDKTVDEYKKIYKEQVIVFSKLEISKKFDEADNFDDRRAIVYARNASFEVAASLGLDYFIQLDDDYTGCSYTESSALEFIDKAIKSLDDVYKAMVDFVENTPFSTLSMGQGGDFLGGKLSGNWKKRNARKCMNTFVCSTKKPFKFIGRINEDVNTYTSEAGRGLLMLTTMRLRITQKATQSNSGGMTDIYLDNGTYIKSFYSVIFSPSCVTVREMGEKHRRLHHRVDWGRAVPKIIGEHTKKVYT